MTLQEKIEVMLKKTEAILNARNKCGKCRHYSITLDHCFKHDMEGKGEFHKACACFKKRW